MATKEQKLLGPAICCACPTCVKISHHHTLHQPPHKGVWWIPLDQYTLKYHAHKIANIPAELEIICQSILQGKYNEINAPVTTIQGAHQAINQSISPCRKSKCSCAGGNCKRGVLWMYQEELKMYKCMSF